MEKEKIKYIVSNVGKMPKTHIARVLGIPTHQVYAILRKEGVQFFGKRTYVGTSKFEKDVAILFPDHSASEISNMIGCCATTVLNISKKLGLSHSKETLNRIKGNMLANLKKAYTKDIIEKRVATRRRRLRMETFRVLSGEQQRTGIKVRKMPRKSYAAKYRLIHEFGYFGYEEDAFAIGYDCNTRRVNEKYYKNKYGFTFEEDKQCQED